MSLWVIIVVARGTCLLPIRFDLMYFNSMLDPYYRYEFFTELLLCGGLGPALKCIKSDQIRSNQIRSNQIRSNQIKSAIKQGFIANTYLTISECDFEFVRLCVTHYSASHHIISHHITLHRITSHNIISQYTTSHLGEDRSLLNKSSEQ